MEREIEMQGRDRKGGGEGKREVMERIGEEGEKERGRQSGEGEAEEGEREGGESDRKGKEEREGERNWRELERRVRKRVAGRKGGAEEGERGKEAVGIDLSTERGVLAELQGGTERPRGMGKGALRAYCSVDLFTAFNLILISLLHCESQSHLERRGWLY